MSTGPPIDDEVPRDAHLRAALRHAADAGALPPHAVAAAIRQAARLAVQPPPATAAAAGVTGGVAASVAKSARSESTLAAALRGFWQSLAAPRPVWAGGAAALVVTLLTVNLWVGEPLPPAVQADGPAVSAPPATVTTAPAPAPAPAVATLPSPSPAPSRADRPRATTAISEARSSRNEAPPTAADESRARAAPLPQTAAPPAATGPITPQPEQAAAPMPSAAAVGTLATPAAPEPAAPTALAKSRSVVDAGAAPSAKLSLATRAGAPPAPPSLTGWLRAARQITDDPAWPLTSAQRRVLQQLALAAHGRWQAAVQPAQPAQPAQSDGNDTRAMSWRSDAGQVVSLRVDSQGAHWTEPDGRSWFAPLDNAARSALLREF